MSKTEVDKTGTNFEYPIFSDEENNGTLWKYYKNLTQISVLDLNSSVPIEHQWHDLDEQQKWHEFQLALKVVLELYAEGDKNSKKQTQGKKAWIKN